MSANTLGNSKRNTGDTWGKSRMSMANKRCLCRVWSWRYWSHYEYFFLQLICCTCKLPFVVTEHERWLGMNICVKLLRVKLVQVTRKACLERGASVTLSGSGRSHLQHSPLSIPFTPVGSQGMWAPIKHCQWPWLMLREMELIVVAFLMLMLPVARCMKETGKKEKG